MAVTEQDVLPRFRCALAQSEADIRESQRLRFDIFAGEMGAAIDGGEFGLDQDALDAHCEHLLVRNEDGMLVASTRLLSGEAAQRAGGFYSAHEFAMSAIAGLDGRKLEVGRTCVHRDYRNGSTIAVLWSGLADYVTRNGIDYLFGCASIPLEGDHHSAYCITEEIRSRYMSAPDLRVEPWVAMPHREIVFERHRMPPLLKAYVSLGARACGEPYFDSDFNCVDVFMLLNLKELHPRYARRFLGARLS